MKLRLLEEKDAERMLEWMHDDEISKSFRIDTKSATIDTVKKFISDAQDISFSRHYAIVDEQDIYMGTISLKKIDTINTNAEYAVVLHKDSIGKGFGKEATRQILKIAFEELNLHKVYLDCLSTNERALKMYEKAGFKYEGELKEQIFVRNEFCSLKLYGILKQDYEKIYK